MILEYLATIVFTICSLFSSLLTLCSKNGKTPHRKVASKSGRDSKRLPPSLYKNLEEAPGSPKNTPPPELAKAPEVDSNKDSNKVAIKSDEKKLVEVGSKPGSPAEPVKDKPRRTSEKDKKNRKKEKKNPKGSVMKDPSVEPGSAFTNAPSAGAGPMKDIDSSGSDTADSPSEEKKKKQADKKKYVPPKDPAYDTMRGIPHIQAE